MSVDEENIVFLSPYKALGRVFPSSQLPGGPGGSGSPWFRLWRCWIMSAMAPHNATTAQFIGSFSHVKMASTFMTSARGRGLVKRRSLGGA